MPTAVAARHPAFDCFGPMVQTGLFALYCLAFFLLRFAFTVTLKQDDAVRHFEAQTLALIYSSNDPALYTWLLWGIQQGVGVGLHSSMLLNYALMTGAFWALLLCSRMVLAEPRWAALAAWSLVLLPPVMLGHFALAHTTQVLFAAALALLALLRLARYGRPVDYILFGAAIGHGFLAKYNFGLFLAAAAIAALMTATLRQRLASRWMAATAGAALLVLAPLLPVLVQTLGQMESTMSQIRHETAGPVLDRLIGLKSAGASLVSYTWPLLLALAASVPSVFRPRMPPAELAPVDHGLTRLLDRYMMASVAVIAAAVLISGIPKFHERYMQSLLFAAPLFAATRIARIGPGTLAWRRYVAALAVAITALAGLRALELSPLCPQACRDLVPYDTLAEGLRARGFDGGTIITGSPVAAGNLRAQFPESRVMFGRGPAGLVETEGDSGQCLVIWDAMDWSPDASAASALGAIGLTPETAADRIETFATEWRWPFFTWSWPPGFEERTYAWRYLMLEQPCFRQRS